jgi:hypothetical protein
MFSKLKVGFSDLYFQREGTGRWIFLPFGLKGKCYFVDSKSDEEKIRAFIRTYCGVYLLFFVIWTEICVFAWRTYGWNRAPAGRTGVMYLVASFLVYGLAFNAPILVLQRIYRRKISRLTASLLEAEAETKRQLRHVFIGRRRRVLIRLALMCSSALLLLLGLMLFLIGGRHSSRKTGSHPPQGQISRAGGIVALRPAMAERRRLN